MGLSTDVLIAEAIPIATYHKGKLEYRYFVVANKLSSCDGGECNSCG
jgi:hypothetical protein